MQITHLQVYHHKDHLPGWTKLIVTFDKVITAVLLLPVVFADIVIVKIPDSFPAVTPPSFAQSALDCARHGHEPLLFTRSESTPPAALNWVDKG